QFDLNLMTEIDYSRKLWQIPTAGNPGPFLAVALGDFGGGIYYSHLPRFLPSKAHQCHVLPTCIARPCQEKILFVLTPKIMIHLDQFGCYT
ncbi:hypothetical protein A2U01_0037717, partial [Trifolium medium]|nr:hypothetical protein [Trifolium medium]